MDTMVSTLQRYGWNIFKMIALKAKQIIENKLELKTPF